MESCISLLSMCEKHGNLSPTLPPNRSAKLYQRNYKLTSVGSATPGVVTTPFGARMQQPEPNHS